MFSLLKAKLVEFLMRSILCSSFNPVPKHSSLTCPRSVGLTTRIRSLHFDCAMSANKPSLFHLQPEASPIGPEILRVASSIEGFTLGFYCDSTIA